MFWLESQTEIEFGSWFVPCEVGRKIGNKYQNWKRNRNRHLHGIEPRTGIEKEIGFEVGVSKIITVTGKVEVDFKFLMIVEVNFELGFEHFC